MGDVYGAGNRAPHVTGLLHTEYLTLCVGLRRVQRETRPLRLTTHQNAHYNVTQVLKTRLCVLPVHPQNIRFFTVQDAFYPPTRDFRNTNSCGLEIQANHMKC